MAGVNSVRRHFPMISSSYECHQLTVFKQGDFERLQNHISLLPLELQDITLLYLLRLYAEKGTVEIQAHGNGSSLLRRQLSAQLLNLLDAQIRCCVMGNLRWERALSDIACNGNIFMIECNHIFYFWHGPGEPDTAGIRRRTNSCRISRINLQLRCPTYSHCLERSSASDQTTNVLHLRGKRLSEMGGSSLARVLQEIGLIHAWFSRRGWETPRVFIWAVRGMPVVRDI